MKTDWLFVNFFSTVEWVPTPSAARRSPSGSWAIITLLIHAVNLPQQVIHDILGVHGQRTLLEHQHADQRHIVEHFHDIHADGAFDSSSPPPNIFRLRASISA